MPVGPQSFRIAGRHTAAPRHPIPGFISSQRHPRRPATLRSSASGDSPVPLDPPPPSPTPPSSSQPETINKERLAAPIETNRSEGDEAVLEALQKVQDALREAEATVQRVDTLPSARLPKPWDPLMRALRPFAQGFALLGYCLLIHSYGLALRLTGGLVLASAIGVWGYRKRSLSPSGALAAVAVGWGTLSSSFRAGVVLLSFFFASSKLTRLGEEEKASLDEGHRAGGQRDWIQVFCNGFVPSILAILAASLTGFADLPLQPSAGGSTARLTTALHASVLGYFACCCGDTWASELGQLSPEEPRLITSLRPVRKGTNGGVTLAGLAASLAGGLAMGLVFYVGGAISPTGIASVAMRQWQVVPLGLVAGLTGSIIDSLLGATVQFTGFNRATGKVTGRNGPDVTRISGMALLDNNAVNVVSATVTAGLTAAAGLALFGRSQQQRRQKRPQTNTPHAAHETPDAAASASAARFQDSRRSAAAVSQPPGHEEWEHGPDGLLLPPHLARYAQPRHQTRGFSGPSVIQAESEDGAVEYKLRLQPNKPGTNPARFQQLVTQLKYRLSQGGGECLYCIGVEDNGHPRGLEAVQLDASLLALREMAAQIGASARVLETLPGTHGRVCAVVRVHAMSAMRTWRHREVRVAVAGAADAGKSTLVAVLTHGADGLPALDNGRGAARMNVLRHKHEVASGRTSSVSVQVAGYERAGEDAPLNYDVIASAAAPTTAGEVASASRKLVRLADLSGHGRFSKTSLHGMTATAPDYACVCVSAVQGLSSVTRDHLAVALALGVPPFVVITKVDGACKEIVDALVRDIASLVHAARRGSRSGGDGGMERDDEACPSTAMFATEDDGRLTLERLLEAREVVAPLVDSHTRAKAASALSFARQGKAQMSLLCVPVLAVSSVSGESIDVLHAFLSSLEVEDIFETDDQGPECGEHARQRYVGHGGFACPHSTSSAAAAATTKLDDKLGVERQQQPDPTPVCRRFDGEIAPGRTRHSETRFQIESSFEVAGVGPVFSGVVQCGKIGLGAELLLGASEETTFRRVRVKGIHRFQVEVAQVVAGQHATIAIDPVDDNDDALSCDRVEEADQSTLDRRETSSDSAGLYACCRIAAGNLEATSDSEQEEEEEEESTSPGGHPATSSADGNKTACCAGMNVPGFHQKLSSPSPLLNDGVGHQDQPTGQPRLIDPDATALPDRSTLTTHSHSPSTDETAFGEASPQRGAALDQQQPEPERSRRNLTSVPPPPHNSTIHTIAMTSTCGEQHQQHQQQRLETDEHCSSSMALLGRSWETASQKWLLKNGSSDGNRGGVGCGAMLSLGSLDRSSSSSSARPRSAHHAAGMTSARWRRGTVLLAPCIRPRAHFVFEAFVVLLGGCWPARGLTSGKYPPEQNDESILTASMLPSSAKHGESSYHRTCSNQSIVSSSSSSSSSASASAFSLMKSEESYSAAGPLWLQRRRRSTESLAIVAPSLTSKSPESNAQLYAEGTTAAAATAQQQQQQQQQPLYVPMVHCGGVRQAAQVIAMEELHPQEAHELFPNDDAVVESCFAAGGLLCAVGGVDQSSSMECALLHGDDDSSDVVTGESNHRCTATCAKVTFRFLHRGEWLVPGARLIVRDLESGRVAGAGAVLAVM